MIGGFDIKGLPHIYATDPSGSPVCYVGSCSEWKANAIGRNSKQVCEYLEKNYKEECSLDEALKLATKALMDVVESGNKNIELLVITKTEARQLNEAEIEKLIASLKE